jgi:hypothetical protein
MGPCSELLLCTDSIFCLTTPGLGAAAPFAALFETGSKQICWNFEGGAFVLEIENKKHSEKTVLKT